MQHPLGRTGYVLITGRIRSDVELIQCKNGSHRAKASVVVDVQRDEQGRIIIDDQGRPKGVWANLTAWGFYARVLGQAQRGDGIEAIGTVQTWEHDGKTYRSLVVNDYGSIKLIYPMQPAGQPGEAEYQDTPEMTDITDDDDGELPF